MFEYKIVLVTLLELEIIIIYLHQLGALFHDKIMIKTLAARILSGGM